MPDSPANPNPPPPPGWPVTDRPLRIALLGWARLSNQALEGSGYNLSASELARGLALSGHHVSYLAAGMIYHLFGAPRVRFRERWGGVDCFDLINSPNLSPSAHNFRNVRTETASPGEAALVVRWLDQIDAEVVHIHSLEGYGLDVIGAIQDSARPVIVTPHNYAFVCPQVDLLHKESTVCEDYDGGRRCVDCLPAPSPRTLKLKRAMGDTLERRLGPYRADVVRKAIYGIKPTLRSLLTGAALKHWRPPVLNPDSLNDPELAHGFGTQPPLPEGGGRGNGSLRLPSQREGPGVGSLPPPSQREGPGVGSLRAQLPTTSAPSNATNHGPNYTPSPPDQNERLLAATHHLHVLNDYGHRRTAGVEALNRASLVIPPSDFLRRVHISMGVDERHTRWVRLGQPHFDRINRRARRSPFYNTRPWHPETAHRPLRLAFFGTTRPNKGLEVLLRAIPLIPDEHRRRCQIIIRALGHDAVVRKRLARFPEVSVSGGYDLTQLIAAAGEYDAAILPHIWLENSPLVMLEHLHAGKFVISSRLGGPVDWIVPPKNGLLFPAGDQAALARCIVQLITGEVPIPSPREIHDATILQSYPDHVREVESIYHEVLGHSVTAPAAPTPAPAAAAPALNGNGSHTPRPTGAAAAR